MNSSNESVQAAIDRACAELELTVKDMGVNLAFAPSNISELEEVLLAVRDMGTNLRSLVLASWQAHTAVRFCEGRSEGNGGVG